MLAVATICETCNEADICVLIDDKVTCSRCELAGSQPDPDDDIECAQCGMDLRPEIAVDGILCSDVCATRYWRL